MGSNIRFTQFISRTNEIAARLRGLSQSSFRPQDVAWTPAVNVYEHDDRWEVCVALAGVKKEEIKVEMFQRRLVFRGIRKAPEQDCEHPPCGRILIMEIPEGIFERTLEFPGDVDVDRAAARQENGWLWITVPKAGKEKDHE